MIKCVKKDDRQAANQLDNMNTMNMVTHISKKHVLKGKMTKKSLTEKHELGVAKSFIFRVKYFFCKKTWSFEKRMPKA